MVAAPPYTYRVGEAQRAARTMTQRGLGAVAVLVVPAGEERPHSRGAVVYLVHDAGARGKSAHLDVRRRERRRLLRPVVYSASSV